MLFSVLPGRKAAMSLQFRGGRNFIKKAENNSKMICNYRQRLPSCWWATSKVSNSSRLHLSFLMAATNGQGRYNGVIYNHISIICSRAPGSKWLIHLSRHCFPIRPGMCCSICDHFRIPWFQRRLIVWSSFSVHGPFIRPGCKTF